MVLIKTVVNEESERRARIVVSCKSRDSGFSYHSYIVNGELQTSSSCTVPAPRGLRAKKDQHSNAGRPMTEARKREPEA